jgi:hypothetical protein
LIKLVEESGCNLGEDAFLTDEIPDQCVHDIDNGSAHAAGYGFDNADGEVDLLVEDIHKEWQEQEAKATAVSLTGAVGPESAKQLADVVATEHAAIHKDLLSAEIHKEWQEHEAKVAAGSLNGVVRQESAKRLAEGVGTESVANGANKLS